MSFLHRVLMVLLLAGQGGVLAELYIVKCGDACGGSLHVMCEAGCNCVFYQGLTVGVCRSAMSNDNILDYDGTTKSTSVRNTFLSTPTDSSKSLSSLPLVLIGVPELTAVSLRLPSSSTVASRSMSLVCRLLVVLLLAGQGRVLAMVNPEGLAECGDHCGGFFQVMCVAGCNCVPYKATTFGVCRPSVLNETELDYDELAACEETIQETMLGGTLRQRGLYRGCLTAPLPPVLSQCLVKLQYPQLSRRLPLFTDVFVCENKTMTD
ncbi:uncharacterized protein [Dermacentor andersoni]|uniref:uncharacterized protein isoform X2 n=1 Tax=Dermacentor andersoni TaxID=34620 RepID=UPI00241747F5|nr:uncharacterized protein LOC129386741 isoform X2 [Dermacentor andersoni]